MVVQDRNEALGSGDRTVRTIIMGKAEELKMWYGSGKLGWLGYLKNGLL